MQVHACMYGCTACSMQRIGAPGVLLAWPCRRVSLAGPPCMACPCCASLPQVAPLTRLVHLYLETVHCTPVIFGGLSHLGSLTALQLNDSRR